MTRIRKSVEPEVEFVCKRERERKRQKERGKRRKREAERVGERGDLHTFTSKILPY